MEHEEYILEVALKKVEIARYNFYHIRWLLLIDCIGFAILMAAVFVSLANPDPEYQYTFKILIMWGVLLLAVGFSQPLILFAQIFALKSPAVESQREPRVYRFDKQGIHIETSNAGATTPWSRVVAIKGISGLWLVYTSRKLAYVIPRRYFSTPRERQRFHNYLMERFNAKDKSVGSKDL